MTPLFKVTLPAKQHLIYSPTIVEHLAVTNGRIKWLHDNNRLPHLVNTYWNGERGVTFVFSDATTATLFRLSH